MSSCLPISCKYPNPHNGYIEGTYEVLFKLAKLANSLVCNLLKTFLREICELILGNCREFDFVSLRQMKHLEMKHQAS